MAEYTKEWITQVRGTMNKTEFGNHIYQYKKNGTKCATMHRNTIGNWESGKTSLPKDVEIFLSLALFDYDKHHCTQYDTLEKRNQRYLYARHLMNHMIGVDLYCRHLHDALLIQVCRGVITFEALLPLETELETALEAVPLTQEEKNIYAIERNTISINEDLNKIQTVDELKTMITVVYKHSFASANRTIGARLTQIYNRRDRYACKVPLGKAIANLAPNYRDSYIRMFKSSFVSRDWLLDLCLHLRFDRAEIDDALECAHMAALSDTEVAGGQCRPDRYAGFDAYPMADKLKIMMLMSVCVGKLESEWDCPPADDLLEAFTLYDYGQRAMKELESVLASIQGDEVPYQMVQKQIELLVEETLKQYLDSVLYSMNFYEPLYQAYKDETPDYYRMAEGVLEGVVDKEGAGKLYYLIALCYTILTGQPYTGRLKDADLAKIRRETEQLGETGRMIYNFMFHILVTMLSGYQLREKLDSKGISRYYIITKTQKQTKSFNMQQLQRDFWEACLCTK